MATTTLYKSNTIHPSWCHYILNSTSLQLDPPSLNISCKNPQEKISAAQMESNFRALRRSKSIFPLLFSYTHLRGGGLANVMSIFMSQNRPFAFHRGAIGLIRFLGNVSSLETQKALPSGGALGGPGRNFLLVNHKKLLSESGLLQVIGAIVLKRQQPTLEEKLISAHHGVVGDRELKVGRDWSLPGAPLVLDHVLGLGKIIGEGDSGAHWSAETFVLGVVHV